MIRSELLSQIRQKNSFLCVGLDSDLDKIPKHLLKYDDPVYEFNRQIVEATKAHCVSYKINTAFYECRGAKGWATLEKTAALITNTHFNIADAKRADIGNTSAQYAKAFFEQMNFDAVTVSPYMGLDCLQPFLDYKDKWTIILALTSNPGSQDFEQGDFGGAPLYESVLKKCAAHADAEKAMFVVGATKAETLKHIRTLVPNHFLLVPGVGAQGGSLEEVVHFGVTSEIGLLVNSSRSIIYASAGEDFAEAAAREAQALQLQMGKLIA
jgi:orotidine-5'-phosphate decarboxylase